jgi:hypothetical protein
MSNIDAQVVWCLGADGFVDIFSSEADQIEKLKAKG